MTASPVSTAWLVSRAAIPVVLTGERNRSSDTDRRIISASGDMSIAISIAQHSIAFVRGAAMRIASVDRSSNNSVATN